MYYTIVVIDSSLALPDTTVSYDGGSSVVDNGNDKGGGETVDAAAGAGGRAGGGEGATSLGPQMRPMTHVHVRFTVSPNVVHGEFVQRLAMSHASPVPKGRTQQKMMTATLIPKHWLESENCEWLSPSVSSDIPQQPDVQVLSPDLLSDTQHVHLKKCNTHKKQSEHSKPQGST